VQSFTFGRPERECPNVGREVVGAELLVGREGRRLGQGRRRRPDGDHR